MDAHVDLLVREWLPLPDAAERTGATVSQLRGLLRQRRLVAAPVGDPPVLCVPAEFVVDGRFVKGLGGTVNVLRDQGYDDEAALRWLFTLDDSLPGRPVDALRENRGTEVRRRAMALGF